MITRHDISLPAWLSEIEASLSLRFHWDTCQSFHSYFFSRIAFFRQLSLPQSLINFLLIQREGFSEASEEPFLSASWIHSSRGASLSACRLLQGQVTKIATFSLWPVSLWGRVTSVSHQPSPRAEKSAFRVYSYIFFLSLLFSMVNIATPLPDRDFLVNILNWGCIDIAAFVRYTAIFHWAFSWAFDCWAMIIAFTPLHIFADSQPWPIETWYFH